MQGPAVYISEDFEEGDKVTWLIFSFHYDSYPIIDYEFRKLTMSFVRCFFVVVFDDDDDALDDDDDDETE